ncbi:MAG: serine hydrolase [Aromatoleum sp.]|jgi:D-alanyl-D-alanine endopeptidase (penicillin-binding protein 7)|uniref:serine hydrolase n=1 Tax=Aromatoleum sp. TaxID=2307007 RepID=UPI00289623DC|nr:serine hydrolase [Aromatoleum sp.]MDT3670389.1 serine hydrolase [Aromatoleum sp.]
MKFHHLVIAVLSCAALQFGFAEPVGAASGATSTKVSKATKATKTKKASTRQTVRKRAAKAAPRKVSAQRSLAAAAPVAAAVEVDRLGLPLLRSSAFLIQNQNTGEVLLEKKSDAVLPIASITKLMTAMVVLDGGQSLSEEVVITDEDLDTLKGTGSRLALGTRLTREQLLHLALMSSENRAASALGRSYPGGIAAFVNAMNIKARMIGLADTHFSDSTGLNPMNVSSPRDLARMVSAASTYPLIRQFSTSSEEHVQIGSRVQRFGNTNSLVRSPEWEIGLSKTGYIQEAGRCLVMQAWVNKQPVIIVLMDSDGRYTRTADAVRVKKWMEAAATQRVAVGPGGSS